MLGVSSIEGAEVGSADVKVSSRRCGVSCGAFSGTRTGSSRDGSSTGALDD